MAQQLNPAEEHNPKIPAKAYLAPHLVMQLASLVLQLSNVCVHSPLTASLI